MTTAWISLPAFLMAAQRIIVWRKPKVVCNVKIEIAVSVNVCPCATGSVSRVVQRRLADDF
jgi:hypothetical protein